MELKYLDHNQEICSDKGLFYSTELTLRVLPALNQSIAKTFQKINLPTSWHTNEVASLVLWISNWPPRQRCYWTIWRGVSSLHAFEHSSWNYFGRNRRKKTSFSKEMLQHHILYPTSYTILLLSHIFVFLILSYAFVSLSFSGLSAVFLGSTRPFREDLNPSGTQLVDLTILAPRLDARTTCLTKSHK